MPAPRVWIAALALTLVGGLTACSVAPAEAPVRYMKSDPGMSSAHDADLRTHELLIQQRSAMLGLAPSQPPTLTHATTTERMLYARDPNPREALSAPPADLAVRRDGGSFFDDVLDQEGPIKFGGATTKDGGADLKRADNGEDRVEPAATPDDGMVGDPEAIGEGATNGGGATAGALTGGDEGVALTCEETCILAQDICRSSQSICSISADNPGETRYAASCHWAESACGDAIGVCDQCETAIVQDAP